MSNCKVSKKAVLEHRAARAGRWWASGDGKRKKKKRAAQAAKPIALQLARCAKLMSPDPALRGTSGKQSCCVRKCALLPAGEGRGGGRGKRACTLGCRRAGLAAKACGLEGGGRGEGWRTRDSKQSTSAGGSRPPTGRPLHRANAPLPGATPGLRGPRKCISCAMRQARGAGRPASCAGYRRIRASAEVPENGAARGPHQCQTVHKTATRTLGQEGGGRGRPGRRRGRKCARARTETAAARRLVPGCRVSYFWLYVGSRGHLCAGSAGDGRAYRLKPWP